MMPHLYETLWFLFYLEQENARKERLGIDAESQQAMKLLDVHILPLYDWLGVIHKHPLEIPTVISKMNLDEA